MVPLSSLSLTLRPNFNNSSAFFPQAYKNEAYSYILLIQWFTDVCFSEIIDLFFSLFF